MDVSQFVDIMKKFGYDLIQYWTHVNRSNESDTENQQLYENPDIEEIYTGCWYGGGFFDDLLFNDKEDLGYVNHIDEMKMYHGEFYSDRECHYFTILTNMKYAYLFNTYGGVYKLVITINTIDTVNKLIEDINSNNIDSLMDLFGVSANYDSYNIEIFELREYELNLPTKNQLKFFIRDLISKLNFVSDKEVLINILMQL